MRIEVPLRFSNEFNYVLREIDSPISDALRDLSGSPSDISLINIGDDNDSATFTTSIKLSQHFNTQDSRELKLLISPLRNSSSEIYHKNRTSIKIGRLLKKLLGSKQYGHLLDKFLKQKRQIDYIRYITFATVRARSTVMNVGITRVRG